MDKQDQRIQALNQKIRGERRLRLMLLPWIKEVAGTYRLGVTQISGDDKNDLKRLLKKYYQQMVNDIMGFDTRQFKDELEDMIDEYYRSVSMHLENTMYVHNLTASAQIANTMEGYMKRVNELAIANGWTPIEARAALVNYMRAHSLVVATTEAQFITEATRTVAIRVVNDPLKDTLMKVVELIESGDNNAARRLSRRAMRLINQPLSMAQGETIAEFREMTSSRDLLMTPEVQGRVIANLRERGRALGKSTKEWSAIGDSKTRETHLNADGQQKSVEEPFLVGGYRLQYPGDASLGASLSEVINCRCAAVYI